MIVLSLALVGITALALVSGRKPGPANPAAAHPQASLRHQLLPHPRAANPSGGAIDPQDPRPLPTLRAVRTLAEQATPEAAGLLLQWLAQREPGLELRIQIAECLGPVDQPGVAQGLMEVVRTAPEPSLVSAALGALGQRDLAETESFLREYLARGDVASELQVEALEALARARGDPTDLLLGKVADPEPTVRAAAAWALSATEVTGNAGPQLLEFLRGETDPEVRQRLYQALGNQQSFDTTSVLSLLQQERNPAARIAGLDLLAKALRDNPTAQLQVFFEQSGIPELKRLAVTGQSYDERQAAMVALTRAHTPGARAALNDVAAQTAASP